MTYPCKEENITIGEYIHYVKGICNSLTVIRSPVPNKVKIFELNYFDRKSLTKCLTSSVRDSCELKKTPIVRRQTLPGSLARLKIFSLLTSLGPRYELFSTTTLKPPRPAYTELVSLEQR